MRYFYMTLHKQVPLDIGLLSCVPVQKKKKKKMAN